MSDKIIAYIVALSPVVIAGIGVLSAWVVARSKRQAKLPEIQQGETVDWEPEELRRQWRERDAERVEEIRSLKAEVVSERRRADRMSRTIAILREHLALDQSWHRRNPAPDPHDLPPEYVERQPEHREK